MCDTKVGVLPLGHDIFVKARVGGSTVVRGARLVRISHHVSTLLVGCRKGGASAPPKSRLPPSVGPVPRAVRRLTDCAGHGKQE